ncbi:MAG: hypothetical protein MZV70_36270 [Desulfobacterales bacterium]|nr:hypothetical protein [Desulfobacterales bacterium]
MRTGIGKIVNTESAFVMGLAAVVFGFVFKANHPDAPYDALLVGLGALNGGFWWKRFKQQEMTTETARLALDECRVDPLMEDDK